jgi:hypothetical protein
MQYSKFLFASSALKTSSALYVINKKKRGKPPDFFRRSRTSLFPFKRWAEGELMVNNMLKLLRAKSLKSITNRKFPQAPHRLGKSQSVIHNLQRDFLFCFRYKGCTCTQSNKCVAQLPQHWRRDLIIVTQLVVKL